MAEYTQGLHGITRRVENQSVVESAERAITYAWKILCGQGDGESGHTGPALLVG